MKKNYAALKAEKIDFGAYDMATDTSGVPAGCIQIVANLVVPGGNTCTNPTDTTSYMYINDHPVFPDD